MGTAVIDANRCWNTVKKLDKGEKIRLIAMLSNSLLQDENNTSKISAKRFYGIWKDADYTDADELNGLIKDSRKFKDDIEAF